MAQEGCRTDANAEGSVLAAGRSIRVGDPRCDVGAGRLVCRNARTRHGFDVSRERFRGY